MSAMEVEAYEKIMNCFQSVRGEQQQAQDENRKLRKDMCAIIKLVQHAFHHNTWNTDDMCLETLTVNQLLGIQGDQARPESETEKVGLAIGCTYYPTGAARGFLHIIILCSSRRPGVLMQRSRAFHIPIKSYSRNPIAYNCYIIDLHFTAFLFLFIPYRCVCVCVEFRFN